MTLKILTPLLIDESDIAATNVALEAEWSAGTYNLGQQVRVDDRLFEVSANSTTEEPSDTAIEWFDAGPANRYGAFDLQVGVDKLRVIETKTKNADLITYTITAPSIINGMAFVQLEATNVRVVASVDATGDVANIDHDLEDYTSYSGSRWRWRYLPQSFAPQFVDFGMNIPAGASIDITITRAGGTATVGSILLGLVSSFGTVTVGTQRSLSSRSVRRTEGTLTSLLRRTPSARVPYQVTLSDYEASEFWKVIDDIDGTAAFFSGSETHPEYDVYGIVSSANTTASGNGIAKTSVEVTRL